MRVTRGAVGGDRKTGRVRLKLKTGMSWSMAVAPPPPFTLVSQ